MRDSLPDLQRRAGSLAATALIIAAIAAGFFFRAWFGTEVLPSPLRMQGETTQAYRYVSMISDGGSVPSIDTLVMHPDGMDTSENSIFEEYLAGTLHRITGGELDGFLRLFCLLFPLLTIPALYLWMRSTGIDLVPAIASSSLYAFLLPALLRTRGESFYRETVALPMLIFLGWLVDASLKPTGNRRRLLLPISAGILLFLSLAAWKVSAYMSLFLFLYLIWRDRSQGRAVPAALKISLAAAQIAASVLLTHMRHDSAYISPATVLAAVLAASVFFRRRSWIPWAATAVAAAAILIGSGSTGHVGAVVLAKVRFLFTHPSDPTLLSEDARLFWVSGYTSPGAFQILFLFGIPFLAALLGIRTYMREQAGTLLFWFLPVSLAGYLFFDRLHVLLAVALVPVIASTLHRARWMAILASAVLIAQSVFPGAIAGGLSEVGLGARNDASLLSETELDSMLLWFGRETDPDEASLSFWHLSGLISAYAERPVVTHTFFENEDNRRTIVQFAEKIFQPEDSLLAFMDAKECEYVVYQADFLLDRSYAGLLYLAGLTEVPEGSAAMLMHWSPDSLDSLQLVFQGPSLRIFSRSEIMPVQLDRQFLFEERYSGFSGEGLYDEARLVLGDPLAAAGAMADAGVELEDPDMLSAALLIALCWQGPAEVTGQMLNDLIQMYIQGIYELDGLAEDISSMQYYQSSVPELHLLLARLYASEGRYIEAEDEYMRVIELDPGSQEARDELQLLGRQGK